MQASGDEWSLSVEDVAHAVIVTDLDGAVVVWNRAAEELYGWSAAEALGRSVAELTSPFITAEILEKVTGSGIWSGELLVGDRTGATFLATVTASPLRDEQGHVIGVLGTSRPAGGPEHRRWRPGGAHSSVAQAFLVLDADGRIIYANEDLDSLIAGACRPRTGRCTPTSSTPRTTRGSPKR